MNNVIGCYVCGNPGTALAVFDKWADSSEIYACATCIWANMVAYGYTSVTILSDPDSVIDAAMASGKLPIRPPSLTPGGNL